MSKIKNIKAIQTLTSKQINCDIFCFSFSSFKSKRYRDKLRTEIKALEAILPVEKTALHRKLDSQTVFRLTIAYFRTKIFLEGQY